MEKDETPVKSELEKTKPLEVDVVGCLLRGSDPVELAHLKGVDIKEILAIRDRLRKETPAIDPILDRRLLLRQTDQVLRRVLEEMDKITGLPIARMSEAALQILVFKADVIKTHEQSSAASSISYDELREEVEERGLNESKEETRKTTVKTSSTTTTQKGSGGGRTIEGEFCSIPDGDGEDIGGDSLTSSGS